MGIAAIIFLQQVPFVTTPEDLSPGQVSTNAFAAAIQLVSTADWSYLPYSLAAVAIVVGCRISGSLLCRHGQQKEDDSGQTLLPVRGDEFR